MTLKSKYDSLEEIPTELNPQDLYEERDGEYVLKKDSIAGVKSDADIARLQTALSKERVARKAAETSLSLFSGSPEDVMQELQDLKDAGAQPSQAHQRELERMKQELDVSASKVSELNGVLGSQKLQAAFVKEATDQGVASAALDDILLWGEKLFTVKDGEVVARDENNLQSPGDWLADLKSSGKKDYWFEQSQGSGAQGGKGAGNISGVEHFSKGNLTKMSQIWVDDKDKAERLAKLAGYSSFNAAVTAAGK